MEEVEEDEVAVEEAVVVVKALTGQLVGKVFMKIQVIKVRGILVVVVGEAVAVAVGEVGVEEEEVVAAGEVVVVVEAEVAAAGEVVVVEAEVEAVDLIVLYLPSILADLLNDRIQIWIRRIWYILGNANYFLEDFPTTWKNQQ